MFPAWEGAPGLAVEHEREQTHLAVGGAYVIVIVTITVIVTVIVIVIVVIVVISSFGYSHSNNNSNSSHGAMESLAPGIRHMTRRLPIIVVRFVEAIGSFLKPLKQCGCETTLRSKQHALCSKTTIISILI